VHPQCTQECPGFVHLGSSSKGNIARVAGPAELKEYVPWIRKAQQISDEELAYLLELSSARSVAEQYPLPEEVDDAMDQDARAPSPPVATTDDVDMRMDEGSEREDMQEEQESDVQRMLARTLYVRERSIASSTSEFSQLPLNSTAREDQYDERGVPRTHHVLYIPDPSRARGSLRDAEADLGYTTRSMPKEDFDRLKSVLPDYLYARRSQPYDHGSHGNTEKKKVRISEWVSRMLSIYCLAHSSISCGWCTGYRRSRKGVAICSL
jgi:hypothetical protein